MAGDDREERVVVDARVAPHDDPFAYLASVIRGDVEPASDLSSLETNLVVMEILDAAMRSARSGETVHLE